MKIIFFICCFILSFFASAQKGNINLISEYEDTLKILAERIVYEELEENRRIANDAFINHLDEVLKYEKSFDYNFDSLKTISVENSPDNQFRIFTWMLRKSNGTYEYYGRVQLKKKRGIKIYNLIDNSKNIRSPEKKVLDQNNWYGGIIYEIIYIKFSRKKLYTILLWDGNDYYSTKKIIDVMQFNGDNISFGKQIFKDYDSNNTRIILEYEGKTSISMKYNKEMQKIVFNHLVPKSKELEGLHEYYIPDGTFNAFNFKKGNWFFEEDIDIRNKNKNIKYREPDLGLTPK